METSRIVTQRPDGTPVYAYDPVPGVPPVRIFRLLGSSMPTSEHAHAHHFLVLTYFERGGGSLRLEDRQWPIEAGDVHVIAPGEVVGVGSELRDSEESEGWAVSFTPDAVGSQALGAFLSWRAHPLLFPFVRGTGEGVQRLRVPEDERPLWSQRFATMDRELCRRRDGYHDALLAHLTLLLVEVGRLAANNTGDVRLSGDPLLADVFRVIEERFQEPISLSDVAHAVNLSPGYLTTVIRRRTGRPVQEWNTERRMAQARRLLIETDLGVDEIGRCVGYRDAGYFTRLFRRSHHTTPLRWRNAGRAA